MSSHLACLEILTKYIGFEETNNGEKLTLPDEVESDSLTMLKNWLIKIKYSIILREGTKPSNDETLW